MINLSIRTLRNRMLLIFLLVIVVIVATTLYLVRSATFQHSTRQVLNHAQTSASVIRDKFINRADFLLSAQGTLTRDFTTKALIIGGTEDKESLLIAMQNQQQRIQADLFLVTDNQQNVLVSSTEELISLKLEPQDFAKPGISWFRHNDAFFLLKSSAVYATESSPVRQPRAWTYFGFNAKNLVNASLVEITNMQISLFFSEKNNLLVASTFSDIIQSQLATQAIQFSGELNPFSNGDETFIYTTFPFGFWSENPLYLLLATEQDAAYLSYNSLIGQLIGLLIFAALLSLTAAMVLSKGITDPVGQLVSVTRRIRMGEFVADFPLTSTTEVKTLSDAISDMQDGIKQREQQINQLAYFDDLTELPNRNQFMDHLSTLIQTANGRELTILVMDVDRFKEINDTVGHDTGDLLLKLIAKRITSYSGESGFYARLGGDEFAMIFESGCHPTPELAAEFIARIFEQPFNLESLVLDVDTSIGVAIYPTHAKTPQGLMQCADIALYNCKDTHHSFAIYQKALNKYSVQRLNLMSELREALVQGQLELYYQPKLLIETQKITSVECLIRWNHPVHGFVPPDDFIFLAEQTGAIRQVTHWALNTALKQHKEWSDMGYQIAMAVNISAIDLVDMKLPTLVADLMTEYQVEIQMLTLEVTESAIMSDPENAMKALNTLQRMGIELSIDDFGTGYSSMAQLKSMPVNELKIDKAFVIDLANNQDDKIMVRTIVSLAQNLSLKTVAEGVEDAATLQFLTEIGCTKAQGYHLSKPLPIKEFNLWLKEFTSQ